MHVKLEIVQLLVFIQYSAKLSIQQAVYVEAD